MASYSRPLSEKFGVNCIVSWINVTFVSRFTGASAYNLPRVLILSCTPHRSLHSHDRKLDPTSQVSVLLMVRSLFCLAATVRQCMSSPTLPTSWSTDVAWYCLQLPPPPANEYRPSCPQFAVETEVCKKVAPSDYYVQVCIVCHIMNRMENLWVVQ